MRTASPSSCYYRLMAGGGRTTERTFSESVRQRPLWRTWTFAGASSGDAGTAFPGDAGNVVSNTPFRECSGPPTREDGEGPRNSEKPHPPSTPPYVCPVNGGATLCRAPGHPLFWPHRPRGHPLLWPILWPPFVAAVTPSMQPPSYTICALADGLGAGPLRPVAALCFCRSSRASVVGILFPVGRWGGSCSSGRGRAEEPRRMCTCAVCIFVRNHVEVF